MNELQIIFQQRIITAKPDNKYRILVDLKRSDRPRYWNALCMSCGSKLVEIVNKEVYSITDFFDPQNLNNSGIGKQCKGANPDGSSCDYYYFFNVN